MTATETVPNLAAEALLAQVLDCYLPHCRYLQSMTVNAEPDLLTGVGTFNIPRSCYINDTGHFNSVEANICYNQMLYQVIATAVQRGHGPFREWTMAEFWQRQLPDVLIAEFSSSFKHPINARSFRGEFTVTNLKQRRLAPERGPNILLDSTFRFRDDLGGACSGSARVVIVGR